MHVDMDTTDRISATSTGTALVDSLQAYLYTDLEAAGVGKFESENLDSITHTYTAAPVTRSTAAASIKPSTQRGCGWGELGTPNTGRGGSSTGKGKINGKGSLKRESRSLKEESGDPLLLPGGETAVARGGVGGGKGLRKSNSVAQRRYRERQKLKQLNLHQTLEQLKRHAERVDVVRCEKHALQVRNCAILLISAANVELVCC